MFKIINLGWFFFRPFGEVTVLEKSTSVDVILSECPEEVPKRWAGDTTM